MKVLLYANCKNELECSAIIPGSAQSKITNLRLFNFVEKKISFETIMAKPELVM